MEWKYLYSVRQRKTPCDTQACVIVDSFARSESESTDACSLIFGLGSLCALGKESSAVQANAYVRCYVLRFWKGIDWGMNSKSCFSIYLHYNVLEKDIRFWLFILVIYKLFETISQSVQPTKQVHGADATRFSVLGLQNCGIKSYYLVLHC